MSLNPPPAHVIEGPGVRLRRATRADLPMLIALAEEPDVAPWWPLGDPEDEFLNDEYPSYVIEVEDQPAGVILFSEEADETYRHAGLDVAVATAYHGRGIGRAALRAMMRYLIETRGHHRITIDPAAANERAIASYERVGFRRVGVMRRYERGPDGEWRDGMLMDAVADELELGD